MSNKNDTLHGGRMVAVELFGAKPGELVKEDWFVSQVRVRDYPALFKISDDEIAFCAKVTGKTVAQVGDLVPASYEKIHAAVQEVNEDGFFIYRARQLERANKSLSDMPAEMVNKLIALNLPTPLPIGQPALKSR